MNSSDGYQDALNQVTRYVKTIGDEIEEEIEGETEDGIPITGYSCSHGTHTYLILATEEDVYFNIQYPVSIDHAVAIKRAPNQGEVQISQSDINSARDYIENKLEAVPQSMRREIRTNLIHIISREGVAANLDTTKSINIHGFQLNKKIFPFDKSFNISKFEDTVQRIVNLGWVGKDYLADAYGIKEERDPEYDDGADGFDL